MYSLKRNLNKSLLFSMILVMLLMLIILNIFIKQLLNEQVLTRLQHDAESLISIIQLTDDNDWEVNPAYISTVYNRVRSGHYYVVKAPKKTILSRSLFDYEVTLPAIKNGESVTYKMIGAGDEHWLVWLQTINKNNHQFAVWVAEDITSHKRQQIKFSIIVILLVIIISALLIYIQQKILKRAFYVFDSLRNNLQDIRQGETKTEGTQVPMEILPLVTEIEMLVEQLRQRIQRTRNAIGNLAHEIKRPLQILSLHIESGDDKDSAIQSFRDIQTIVDRELRRAKVSGSNVVGGVFRVEEEIPYLVEVLRKIYPSIDVQVNLQTECKDIYVDRDDMLELIGNLLDNACKFARAQVKVSIQVDQQTLLISVEDDGPGVESEQLKMITEKGLRLDETVEGHGLGLSICTDIINSYQGQLEFQQSILTGLKVDVSIPIKI